MTEDLIKVYFISLDNACEEVARHCQVMESKKAKVEFEFIPFTGQLSSFVNQFNVDIYTTAGNSYGEMSGGIDGAYIDLFGRELEWKVRSAIQHSSVGHLPVGKSVVVYVPNTDIPLIYTPTMSVPMVLPKDSLAAFYAVSEIVRCTVQIHGLRVLTSNQGPSSKLIRGKNVRSILIPLMGYGTGGMAPEVIGRQTAHAFSKLKGWQYNLNNKIEWLRDAYWIEEWLKGRNIPLT